MVFLPWQHKAKTDVDTTFLIGSVRCGEELVVEWWRIDWDKVVNKVVCQEIVRIVWDKSQVQIFSMTTKTIKKLLRDNN